MSQKKPERRILDAARFLAHKGVPYATIASVVSILTEKSPVSATTISRWVGMKADTAHKLRQREWMFHIQNFRTTREAAELMQERWTSNICDRMEYSIEAAGQDLLRGGPMDEYTLFYYVAQAIQELDIHPTPRGAWQFGRLVMKTLQWIDQAVESKLARPDLANLSVAMLRRDNPALFKRISNFMSPSDMFRVIGIEPTRTRVMRISKAALAKRKRYLGR